MSCRASCWSRSVKKRIESDIDEWSIEDPGSSMTISVGLDIFRHADGLFSVILFNGVFGDVDIGTFEIAVDADRFARAFMREVDTWKKLEAYFRGRGLSETWGMLYR